MVFRICKNHELISLNKNSEIYAICNKMNRRSQKIIIARIDSVPLSAKHISEHDLRATANLNDSAICLKQDVLYYRVFGQLLGSRVALHVFGP